jgi:hypothetical protein
MKKPNAFLSIMLMVAMGVTLWSYIALAQTVPSFNGGPTSSVTASNAQFTNITVSNITLNIGTMTGTGQIATNVLPATYANWLLHDTNGGSPTLALCTSSVAALTVPSGSVGYWTDQTRGGTIPCDSRVVICATNGNSTSTNVGNHIYWTNFYAHPYLNAPVVTWSLGTNSNDSTTGAQNRLAANTSVISTTSYFVVITGGNASDQWAAGIYYTMNFIIEGQ